MGHASLQLGDVTVTDCDFTGIPKEHGIYDSLSGHALYRGNTFLGLGGQVIQLAHRATPYAQYGADNLRTARLLIVDTSRGGRLTGREPLRVRVDVLRPGLLRAPRDRDPPRFDARLGLGIHTHERW